MYKQQFPLTYKVIYEAVKNDMYSYWAVSKSRYTARVENAFFDHMRDKIRDTLKKELSPSDCYEQPFQFIREHVELVAELFNEAFDAYLDHQAIYDPQNYDFLTSQI